MHEKIFHRSVPVLLIDGVGDAGDVADDVAVDAVNGHGVADCLEGVLGPAGLRRHRVQVVEDRVRVGGHEVGLDALDVVHVVTEVLGQWRTHLLLLVLSSHSANWFSRSRLSLETLNKSRINICSTEMLLGREASLGAKE